MTHCHVLPFQFGAIVKGGGTDSLFKSSSSPLELKLQDLAPSTAFI